MLASRQQPSTRPSLKRTSSAASLPTPPSSPIAGTSTSRRTPEPATAKRQRRECTPPLQAALPVDVRETTPPNLASSSMEVDDVDDDPFAAPKQGKVYKGKGLLPKDGRIRSYVYRGKKVTLDASAGSDDEDLPSDLKPKLLFPTATTPSPTKNIFARTGAASSSTPSRSPVKALHKPSLAFMPPTPQSLHRHSRAKKSSHGSAKSLDEADSDEEMDLELDAATSPADVFGGETFRPKSMGDKGRVRQGQDFARRAGGLFFR